MRTSKNGNAVYAEVGFWLEQDGSIHLSIKGIANGHVAVNQDPNLRNGHPTLYAKLNKAFQESGAPHAINS